MKTQHTPGPWKDDGHDGKDTQIVFSKWGEIARVVYNGDTSQRTANARLIAAAPELLEALQSLQKELRAHIKFDVKKHYSLMVAENVASKALTKATGQTH